MSSRTVRTTTPAVRMEEVSWMYFSPTAVRARNQSTLKPRLPMTSSTRGRGRTPMMIGA